MEAGPVPERLWLYRKKCLYQASVFTQGSPPSPQVPGAPGFKVQPRSAQETLVLPGCLKG